MKFKCPECGKTYILKDKLQGRKGKCVCGAVILIPSNMVSNVPDSNNTGTLIDEAENVQHTISPSKVNKQDDLDSDLNFFDKEKILKKNFLSRLFGCSIGFVITCIVAYIVYGVLATIFVGVIGIVFTTLMVKKGHQYDLKATKNKETYHEYKARFKTISNTPQSKLAITVIILMLCISLFFMIYQLINTQGNDELLDSFASFFTTHIRLKLILLLINIPLFLLIGRLMVGSWEKYWRVNKWHFIPFHFLFKGWWKFLETTSFEELMLVGAVDVLCIVVYLVEYLFIKVLFLS